MFDFQLSRIRFSKLKTPDLQGFHFAGGDVLLQQQVLLARIQRAALGFAFEVGFAVYQFHTHLPRLWNVHITRLKNRVKNKVDKFCY